MRGRKKGREGFAQWNFLYGAEFRPGGATELGGWLPKGPQKAESPDRVISMLLSPISRSFRIGQRPVVPLNHAELELSS